MDNRQRAHNIASDLIRDISKLNRKYRYSDVEEFRSQAGQAMRDAMSVAIQAIFEELEGEAGGALRISTADLVVPPDRVAETSGHRDRSNYDKMSLINDVAAGAQGFSRRQVAEIVDAALKAITDKVRAGQKVTITGFGTFRRTERAARRGTNIRTRQPINIPAQSTVRFTPGSELKAAVSGRAAPRRNDKGVQERARGQSSTRR